MLAQFATDKILKKLDNIEEGTLHVTTPDGKKRSFQGKRPGIPANVEIRDWKVLPNLVAKGNIGFADDYRNGLWDVDDLQGLFEISLINADAFQHMVVGEKFAGFKAILGYLLQRNTVAGSKKNIHAHYDLGNAFYKLWLDPTMTYSSALYKYEDEDMVSAQHNKYDRILSQFENGAGDLLEIGCGWGGFAERSIEKANHNIRGVTISDEQYEYAQKRVEGHANIVMEDYRHQSGKFDQIVSIEMFEAVGEAYWQTYFQKVAALLKDKGKAVIQTITIREQDFEEYKRTGDFIRSYIFPGGMLPTKTRFAQEANKAGLNVGDFESFGQSYSRTLSEWLGNFDSKRNEVLALGFDESFIRLWRFYLAACAAGFKAERTDVMQISLTHQS